MPPEVVAEKFEIEKFLFSILDLIDEIKLSKEDHRVRCDLLSTSEIGRH